MESSKLTILTGDRPTGHLHLGHYVGSLKSRVDLQYTHNQYIEIADVQALTDNYNDPEKVRNNVPELVIDYLSVGIDPAKTTIFVQSQLSEVAELTVFLLNLVTLARLKRNPTVKSEMREKGFDETVPAGFLVYPVSQAADIMLFKTDVVPVGEDQLPVLEQTNELVESFNRIYGQIFKRIKPLISKTPRLKGIDGKFKMSKSLDNGIYLSDSDDEVTRKVMMMYTDPTHIHVSDPGKIENNVVFEYLDALDEQKVEISEIKTEYQKGGLGDVEIKKRLTRVINDILNPIREKREHLEKDAKYIMEIIEDGSKEARKIAKNTMAEVKQAMKINYFG